ncbi:MAG TPA: O-antigen ligase family protein [Terriglobales bacterium]
MSRILSNDSFAGTEALTGRLASASTIADSAASGNGARPAPSSSSFAFFWLILFFLVYCARPEDWIPGLAVIPLAKIAGVFCLLSFVATLGRARPKLPREMIYLILLVTQLWLTVPMSPVWRGGAFTITLDFSKVLLIMFVMTATVTTMRRLRQLIFVQTACVAVVAAVTLIKGQLLLGRLTGAINGIYANPNELALTLIFVLPLALAFLLRAKGILRKVIGTAAVLVLVYVTVLTGSRAGLIALIVSGGVCLWEFGVRGRRPGLVVVAGGLGLAMVVSAGSTVTDRFKAMFSDEQPTNEAERAAYGSAKQRQDLFWKSLAVTAEHPLFGVGPGNFNSISGNWHDQHNSYTQMSSEGGVPALALYLLILWRAFANLRQTRRSALPGSDEALFAGALRGSLGGYVIGSFFAAVAYHFFPYFLVGYTSALAMITTQDESVAEEEALGQENQHHVVSLAY